MLQSLATKSSRPSLPDRAQAASELLKRRHARASLAAFIKEQSPDIVPAAHHLLLIEKLEAVARGEIRRLMIFMPPGSAKSTYASVFFPPWYLGLSPEKCIITASYGQRLSMRFGKKCRNIVGGANFKRLFGFGLASDASAKDEWETDKGGEFTATSVDGAVTGRRGDLILVDDPIKGRKEADSLLVRDTAWEWWRSDLRTRLKPGGAIVLIMTRWHEDDVAGRILPPDYDGESGEITGRDGEVWTVVSLRAEAEDGDPLGRRPGEFIWPEWFTQGFLAQEKIVQGARNWSALYQQRPSPEEGDFFKREWLRWYDAAPALSTLRIYGASDYAVTANGGDFTVHLVAGIDPNDDLYLLDLWRKQAAPDEWVESWIDLARKWSPVQWAEEAGQIAKGIGPFLDKRQRETQVYCYRESFVSASDKPTRAQAIRGRMAMRKVYLPSRAPWVTGFVSELLAFPTAANDDQVDTLGLLGRLLNKMLTGRPSPGPQMPLRGTQDMTMNEAWKLLQPKPKDGNQRI